MSRRKGHPARPLGDSVHGDRHVVHARRRLERKVIQAERREDPPPLFADLDCAVRGPDPFLRVCLGSSVISQSTPSREHAPRTKVPTDRTFGPEAQRHGGNPSALCVTLYAGRHFCVVGPEAVEELRGLRGPPREPMPASLTTTHQGSRDVHCCRFDAPPRTTGVPPNPIVPVRAVTTAHACRISVRAIVEGPRGRAGRQGLPRSMHADAAGSVSRACSARHDGALGSLVRFAGPPGQE
jgi:hypothetical protein